MSGVQRDLDADVVVIGAGVVGLAVAARLARAGREVLVLEREAHFGSATSSRSSEVVHAGLYYRTGSLKARHCVAGRTALYAWCEAHAVPHRRCGKLVVATTPAQVATLDAIAAHARANGVDDIRRLERDAALVLEPALECRAALFSPSTGIVDSHAFMLSLLGAAESRGGVLATRVRVTGIARGADGAWCVDTVDGGGAAGDDVGGGCDAVPGSATRLRARAVVNAAGHGACALGPAGSDTPRAALAKGSYFRLEARAPFTHLIYPMPEPGGLGVHLTLDLAGRARFGPDVEWVERHDHAVDPARAAGFAERIRRYWPGLPEGALAPDYAGIRPKIRRGDEVLDDFVLRGDVDGAGGGRIDLYGIESPGLTAALSLADEVGALLRPRLDPVP